MGLDGSVCLGWGRHVWLGDKSIVLVLAKNRKQRAEDTVRGKM